MLQDYSSTQNDFRRFVFPLVADPRRGMGAGQGSSMDPSSHPGHPQYPGLTQIGRPVDTNQYQTLLTKIQSQLDAFNGVRELAKKFLESSSTAPSAATTAKWSILSSCIDFFSSLVLLLYPIKSESW